MRKVEMLSSERSLPKKSPPRSVARGRFRSTKRTRPLDQSMAVVLKTMAVDWVELT